MVKLTVKAKRSHFTPPLNDLNLIVLDNFNTEFEIPVVTIKDDGAEEVFETLTFTPEAVTPEPPEPPIAEDVIWDSMRDGKWDKKRVVTDKDGDTKPNGKGIFMAASGDPELHILGNGEAELRCQPGHGRFYICACNYNSVMELEFNIKSDAVDNLSLKARSRHQSGGDCEERFGGCGGSISLVDIDSKIENCHNVHSNSKGADLKQKLKAGTWYKARMETKDSQDGKQIIITVWLDYNDGKGFIVVLQNVVKEFKDYWHDKNKFAEESWFWIRMNNEKDGVIALRNVKIMALPSS